MIKRKADVDNNAAFEASCQDNDIALARKGVNVTPVSYIDLQGQERVIESQNLQKEVLNTNFSVGDIIKVYSKIRENNREQLQVFRGVVVERHGDSSKETFTVRRFSDGMHTDATFYLSSHYVEKIEIVRKRRMRRERLNYLKERVGKEKSIKKSTNA